MSGSEKCAAPLGSSSTGCTTGDDLEEYRARSILDGWDELRKAQDHSVECGGAEEVHQGPGDRRNSAPQAIDVDKRETIASKLRGWTTKRLLRKKDTNRIVPESISPLTRTAEDPKDVGFPALVYSPDSYQELVKQKLSESRRLPTVEEGSMPNSSCGRENSQMSGFSGWSESSRVVKSSTVRFVDAARAAMKQAKSKRMRTGSFAKRWKQAALNPSEKILLLSPFVPRMLKDTIREGAKAAETIQGSPRHVSQVLARKIKPSMTGMTGAVMVADVTGFTKLTEILSKRGSSGVELLTKCMNNYFTKVMSIVFDYDGDVTKFAGDSMIIAFYSTQDEKANSTDNGLKRATLRCVCCAHELTTAFGKMLMLPNGEVIPQRHKRASAFGINIPHDIIGAASAASFDRSVSMVHSALGRLKIPHLAHHIQSVSSTLRTTRAFYSRGRHGDACSQERDDDLVSSPTPSGLRNESTRYSTSGTTLVATSSATAVQVLPRIQLETIQSIRRTRSLEIPAHGNKLFAGNSAPVGEGLEDTGGTSADEQSSCSLSLATLCGRWLRIASSTETVRQQSCVTTNRRSSTVPVAPQTPQNSDKVAPRVSVDNSSTQSSESRQLNNATQLRASIVDIRNKQGEETRGGATHVLALKVMIGVGSFYAFQVGGQEESTQSSGPGSPRFEYFIGDKPRSTNLDENGFRPVIEQIQAIEDFADAGDVIVSEEALNTVRTSLGYVQLSNGAAYRITSTPSGERIKIPSQISKVAYARIFTALPKGALMKSLSIMRMHILDSVREKVEAGQQEFVNEVRRLTVVFLGFPTLKEPRIRGEKGDEVLEVQAAMETVQRCMRLYGGGLLQFRCDEKGFLAICAFGLPGRNHRDNCTRAIHSALKIVEVLLKKQNSRVCAGVTTGDLLCACVGSKDRYEYTVFGDAINLSARLMCKSKAGLGSVLCDEMTRSAAQEQAKYFPLDPLQVKGKEDPVKVYRVESNADKKKGVGKGRRRRRSAIRLPPMALRPLVGRDDVMFVLNDRIKSTLTGESKGGTILVEGDAGMGKTKIVFELQRSDFGGMRHQAHLFCASSYAANKSILLQPWQIIFKEIFSTDLIMGLVEEAAPPNRRRSPLLDIMEDRSIAEDWNVHPVTQLGQVLSHEIEDYADGWRVYLGETLDIPPETLPVGRALLPVNLSFSNRKSIERSRGAEQDDGLVLDDPTRGLLSLGCFLHAVKQETNSTGDRLSISIESDNLKLKSGPIRKAISVDSSFEKALLEVQKEPAESAEDKSDSHQRPVRRMISMDSIVPPGTVVQRRAPNGPIDRSTSIDLKPPGDTNNFINKSFPALRNRDSMVNTSTTGEGLTSFVAANVNGLNARSTSYEDVGLGCVQVTKELKTERLLDVMTKVISTFARLYGPVIIIIENVQHMDSVSWMLLNKLSEEGDGSCLVIVTLRPNDGSLASSTAEIEGKHVVFAKTSQQYKRLASSASSSRIKLEALNLEDTERFMAAIADGEQIPENVVTAVWEKSSGVPMFVEQVTLYLLGKGILGAASTDLKRDDGLLDFIRNEVSIHHMIMDQVDRLRPSTHLTLKVAAVVSTNITVGLLRDIYPSATSRETLEEDLVELEQTGFLRQSVTNVNSWQFTTMVARDVVYGLIPSSQQQQLHAKLAEVLTGYGKKTPTTTIAFHWSQSCLGDEVAEWRRAVMAMRWWERAANEAAEKWALAEAVRLYQKAADLASILSRFYERREERDVAEFMLKGEESAASFTDAFSKPSSPSLSPTIPILKRVWWERRMADMCLLMSENDPMHEKASENRHSAKKHVLTGLSLLRAPLPGDDNLGLAEGCRLCTRIMQCASAKSKGFDAIEFGEEGFKHIARFLEILFSLSVERTVDDRVDVPLLNYCWKLTNHYRGNTADEQSSLHRITQRIKNARDSFYTEGTKTTPPNSRMTDQSNE